MGRLDARQGFLAEIAEAEDAMNLGKAALLIAQEEYPGLNIQTYLGLLDRMAAEVEQGFQDGQQPYRGLEALNRYLFDILGFTGNAEAYYDPRNSFLNEVLDRRTGIPITLSLVYLEVGWRLGMPLQGIGFPGHFLVKYVHEDGVIVLDPFHRGMVLTTQECQSRLDQLYGRRVHFHPSFLSSVTKRKILMRILTNLKGIYASANDHPRALAAVERILAIDPDLAPEIRDRGILRMQVRQTSLAIGDLERYLAMNPQAADVEEIRKRLRGLRQAQASLN